MIRFLLLPIVLTFIVIPMALSVSPATSQHPIPTPTQEVFEQQLAVNGSLLRNVRNCPDLSCAYQYALQPRAAFWFCWQVGNVRADGYQWVLLPDGNWVSVSKGSRQYVVIGSDFRSLSAEDRGCDVRR